MKCPFCNHHGTDVKDSRPGAGDVISIRRRRLCPNCNTRFTTFEEVRNDTLHDQIFMLMRGKEAVKTEILRLLAMLDEVKLT